jgi:hypothetical protein
MRSLINNSLFGLLTNPITPRVGWRNGPTKRLKLSDERGKPGDEREVSDGRARENLIRTAQDNSCRFDGCKREPGLGKRQLCD